MTVQSQNSNNEQLRSALVALREQQQHCLEQLTSTQLEDFDSLFTATERMLQLQGSAASDHDKMNALAAVRGYGEMLSEDLQPTQPGLYALIVQLLEVEGRTEQRVEQRVDQSAKKSAEESGEGKGQEPTSASSSADSPTLAAEPGFILAVDDLQENRELVARSLTRSGHFVVTASSGEEALRTLAESDVDVVLLDLMMPGMDGREVLRRIKDHPEWRATPVIVISGRQDMDGIIECIEAGADDYLFKPFNPVLLRARIKAGIERKRWHDREEQYRQQLERNEKFIRATFGRYLSDEIVTDILERPEGLELGGDLRQVTILMSDIRSFTTLSEQLAPAQVVSMLNRYLGAMTEIIMRHQGTIDEFIGDAILAVFGAPQRRDDDPDRAVRCAVEMQAAMAQINAVNRAEGLPEIETGIALNTGEVIAGNIGSERRSKYGFVGHPMNVTSRIEDLTGGGEILISDSTLQLLKAEYAVTRSQQVSVKGIAQPIMVHAIQEPAQ